MKNYIQPGTNLTLPAPAAVSSGGVVIVGSIIGIASGDAESGAPVVVVTEGCFTLPKVATDAITAGERVYWDSDPGICTDVSTDNTLLGVAIEAAPNPSGTVKVRLSGF